MDERDLWHQSAQDWINAVSGFEFTREIMLDATMLELCGEVAGKRVLDVGCGEGRFCRKLADRGARMMGLDPTLPLLREAQRRDGTGAYLAGNGECLPFLSGSSDCVVTYLSLIDIPDFRASIREMARVLKPGGTLVVGNLQSFTTTQPNGWTEDEAGNPLYFPVDNYSQEFSIDLTIGKVRIINYHRPLSAYMECFLAQGLILRRFLEPTPSEEQVAKNPRWDRARRVPYTLAMLWEKA